MFTGVVWGQHQQKADSVQALLAQPDLSDSVRYVLLRTLAHDETNFALGLEYAQEALFLAEALDEPTLEALAWEEIGAIQRLLGNRTEAETAALTALRVYELAGDSASMGPVLTQLGNNALSDAAYLPAIDYYQQALLIYGADSITFAYVGGLLNLGEAYRLAGRWAEAHRVMERTLVINEQLSSPIIEAYTLGNWGMVLRAEGDLPAAQSQLEASLALTRTLGDPYATAVYQAELGQVFWDLGDLFRAQQELQAALALAKAEGLKEQIRDISAVLVALFQGQENYAEAFRYQQLFQTYQDSLVNRENIQALERAKAGYEIDKRESEIGLLQQLTTQQRYVNLGLGAVVGLVALLAIVLYRSNTRRKRTNQQLALQKEQIAQREQEKGLLLRELNHRVKNNLQMIASLLSLQENSLAGHPAEQAIASGKYRVEALSLIHRRLYREDHETTVPLHEYLEELVLNLCMAFDERVKPQLDLPTTTVDMDQAVPLALIVNELATNALKYAFEGIAQPELRVRIAHQATQWTLHVADNGVGMPDTTTPTQGGFGTQLVRSLASQLGASLDQTSEGGTHWTLTLPKA